MVKEIKKTLEENKKLKTAVKLMFFLLLLLTALLIFNMQEISKQSEISSGSYITVEECNNLIQSNNPNVNPVISINIT